SNKAFLTTAELYSLNCITIPCKLRVELPNRVGKKLNVIPPVVMMAGIRGIRSASGECDYVGYARKQGSRVPLAQGRPGRRQATLRPLCFAAGGLGPPSDQPTLGQPARSGSRRPAG